MKRHINNTAFLVLVLILGVAPIFGKEASLTQAEIRDGWILLFDGESMFGLSQEGQLAWLASNGVLVADGSGAGYIRTDSPFSDFVLKMDVRLSNQAADAALYIRTARDGSPTDNGYQIRIGDGNPSWPAGSVVSRFKANAVHPQGGQWHSFEVHAEGDHITVLLDQKTVADGNDSTVRAGYVGFEVSPGARLEIRDLKLKPITNTALFNGTDLTGWKTVMPAADTGKQNKLKKLIPFAGGGKAKESLWSVQSGAIHGEKGPGQLETVATYDDFILQFGIPASAMKPQGHHTIYIRGDAGKIFTGYEISMDPERPGALAPNLATPRRVIPVRDLAIGTVAVTGRHLEIWVNGFPVTDFTDTRPDGASTVHNAKTSAGAIGLPLHDSNATANYNLVRLSTMAKPLGGDVGKPPPPAAAAAPAAASTPVASAPVIAVNPEAQQQEENRKEAARLMQSALASNNPQEQKDLYQKVIALDPNNSAAAQGYKEADEKLHKQAEEAQKQAALATQQQQNQSASEDALQKAQLAFFAGDLKTADGQLTIAERLAPNSQAVTELRQKVNAARAQNSRLRYLFVGSGMLALGGLCTLFFIRLQKKHGFVEIVSGMDNGRRYNLDQEVVRIGAVAEDGSERNDIVVRDRERMVSRFHCQIHQAKGKFYLIDCNSANGTRIDKKAVPPEEPQRLRSGARVDLAGTVTLLFGLERRQRRKAS